MPIYDYLCASCRHLVEVIHGIHEPGPRFCPACGADGTMRKALTSPTVHFKGSGWAKKDRSSTSGTRTKAGSSSTSGDAGAGDAAEPAGKSVPASEPDSGTTGTATASEA